MTGAAAGLPVADLERTGLAVTRIGLGTGPFGGFSGRPVDDDQAEATVAAAWDAGIRLFDTAPWYGLGAAEHRLGRALRRRPRESFVISTKVGRVLERPRPVRGGAVESAHSQRSRWENGLPFGVRFDYTREGVLRSFEDSLQRLGLDRVDLLLIHDLEPGAHGGPAGFRDRVDELTRGGGFSALSELREEHAIAGIGLGINDAAVVPELLSRCDLDVVLQAGEWTLLDQRALDSALPACQERGVPVIGAGVLGSGILADAHDPGATYDTAPAPAGLREQVDRLARLCAAHGSDLVAAALAFPFTHPALAAVVVGAARPAEIRALVERFAEPPSAELWTTLRAEGLLRDPRTAGALR